MLQLKKKTFFQKYKKSLNVIVLNRGTIVAYFISS